MKAPLLLALAAVSVALVGYAVVSLQAPSTPRPRAREAPASTKSAAPVTATPDAAPEPPIVQLARAAEKPPVMPERPAASREDDEAEPAPAKPALALPITRAATEAAFEALLGELEGIEDPRKLSPERRAELFRQTNDALAALSTQLGDDETEALEDAYARVQAQVGRLRLRGKP